MECLFCLLGACTGYMAIRDPAGFDIQRVLCYIFLMGLRNIFMVVYFIQYCFVGFKSTEEHSSYQEFTRPAKLGASVVIYTVGVAIAYVIYEEIRRFINEGSDAMMQGQQGGPGGGYAAPPEQSNWRHAANNPGANPYADNTSASSGAAAAPSGFTPFSGKGYSLA
mmetsp:Transcript_476/g.668  ORF Transcript_476/g.668 Transcript_476/m.668 type:complete len:166 (-) Transcript_476:178-675(-)